VVTLSSLKIYNQPIHSILKNTTKPIYRSIVQSKFLDVFAVVFILGICYWRDFQGTIFYQGEIQFGIPMKELWNYMQRAKRTYVKRSVRQA